MFVTLTSCNFFGFTVLTTYALSSEKYKFSYQKLPLFTEIEKSLY